MDEAAKKLLGRLQNLCAKQECCSADMLQKALKALDFDRAAAQEVVDALVKDFCARESLDYRLGADKDQICPGRKGDKRRDSRQCS